MDKEEQLLREYQNTRIKLEEQEDGIKRVEKQGQQLADEMYSEIRYLLPDSEDTKEILEEARRELGYFEEELMFALEKEKKKLVDEQEKEEERYRKEVRLLKERD